MGTEIQSKTYFPGYYSMRNLNDNASTDFWALCHEERTLKNGQNYDLLLTRPFVDGYSGYDKEQLRQTILKHESIFRHQLQELHRLYKRQRDLMNEIGRREPHKHLIPAETSQPSLFFSQIPSEDAKKTYVSNLPFENSNSIQSPLSLMNRKNMSGPLSFEDAVTFKNVESLESKCNMFQKKMFNPELTTDLYMHNKGKQLEERVFGVSGMESYPLNSNCEVKCGRDGKLSVGSGLNSGCNGEASRCNLFPKRTRDMADLNEPIQVEGTPASISVDNLGNITCLEEEIRRRDVFVHSNSSFHLSSKRSSQPFLIKRDGGISPGNLHSENEREPKEQLTYIVEAGKNRCDTNLFCGVVRPEDSATPFKSLQVEPRNPLKFLQSDKSKIEPLRKRRIFGVEIPEGVHDHSAVASHTPTQHPVIPQSEVANEFVGGKMHVTSGSTSSLRVQESYQNGLCLGSQSDAKQLPCYSSIGFGFPCGINSSISRPEQSVPHGPRKIFEGSESVHYRFQDGVIPQQNPASVDVQSKYENPRGGLPWLKREAFSSGELTKRSHQMNFDSLENSSLQFSCKIEIGKNPSPIVARDSTSSSGVRDAELKNIGVGEYPSNRRIFGFSIVDMPHTSKDLTSLSPTLKSDGPASEVDGDSIRKGLAHDPKSGDQHKMNDLVTEKGLGNYISGLKHHIDLNLCLNEEEDSTAPSLPRSIVKIATTEIDLEAPAVLESETDLSLEADSSGGQLKKPSELSIDDSKESHEELVRIAAEAIIDISSSGYHVDIAHPHSPEASCFQSLHWFADLVSSCEGNNEGEVKSVSMDTNGPCHEESISDGMDYFEFMTLQLTDTKVEECSYKPPVLENQKCEETSLSVPKRPRKGQAKRGRQQKDFQRDILPGLVSLSRHEVTEDLQIIEDLFRVSGCTWNSSLSQKNFTKSRRRRKNSGVSAPSLAASAIVPPAVQEPIYTGLGLEGRSLTGWGKRTRRLPRQRCPADNPSLAIKC
ncbi:uncharacterized protein LOC132315949 isoform X2 [Cornus florida]|uniref:uncharacterized protein LOC132315949 isoform X2 n=1 Tax=Cornus florida TaxID=4283 RepID=UPI0028981F00|nr:uncharacterized protein LOC132315949 isoform X2 [Cornus florida]